MDDVGDEKAKAKVVRDASEHGRLKRPRWAMGHERPRGPSSWQDRNGQPAAVCTSSTRFRMDQPDSSVPGAHVTDKGVVMGFCLLQRTGLDPAISG